MDCLGSGQVVATPAPPLLIPYTDPVPKLWTESIEAHRQAVRNATLDAAAALIAQHGVASVTMSQIAEQTGIGRATLYKYFSDVESILVAWHERQVAAHLDYLVKVRDRVEGPSQRLQAVLEAYASMARGSHGNGLVAFLHRSEHVAKAHAQLVRFVRDLVAEAARAGELRDDVAPEELAGYCLHALSAAGSMPSRAAVRRLVAVTMAGLRGPTARPTD